jgi:diadenosine tetraphosphate (Ap4A) HIT family hydrolase
MPKSLFEKLADNEIPNWKVWEDEQHMAFLTPFPNTPGQTVVAPKKNLGDDAFELSDLEYQQLLLAAKKMVVLLKKSLKVSRVAMVIEGTGVPHVHIKLYPLYGDLARKTNVWSASQTFFPKYLGYLSTIEGPKMADEELTEMQQRIKLAIK